MVVAVVTANAKLAKATAAAQMNVQGIFSVYPTPTERTFLDARITLCRATLGYATSHYQRLTWKSKVLLTVKTAVLVNHVTHATATAIQIVTARQSVEHSLNAFIESVLRVFLGACRHVTLLLRALTFAMTPLRRISRKDLVAQPTNVLLAKPDVRKTSIVRESINVSSDMAAILLFLDARTHLVLRTQMSATIRLLELTFNLLSALAFMTKIKNAQKTTNATSVRVIAITMPIAMAAGVS